MARWSTRCTSRLPPSFFFARPCPQPRARSSLSSRLLADSPSPNSQSFRRTSTLLIGDSQGSIRHFSLRNASFLPFPDLTSSAAAALASTSAGAKKGPPSISCLALNPDWTSARRAGGSEPRWMAGVGFDNCELARYRASRVGDLTVLSPCSTHSRPHLRPRARRSA